jgi:hypothetical protein
MNERLQALRQRVRNREHQNLRCEPPDLLAECAAAGLSWMQRSARLVRRMCEAEAAHARLEPGEQIAFWRATRHVPPVYNPGDWAELTAGRTLHELGPISNICADWGQILSQGLLGRRQIAEDTRRKLVDDPQAVEFLDCAWDHRGCRAGVCRRSPPPGSRTGRYPGSVRRSPRSSRSPAGAQAVPPAVWLGRHYPGLGRLTNT